MKKISSEKIMTEVSKVVSRFPIAILISLVLTVLQFYHEEVIFDLNPTNLVFQLGILLSMTGQLAYERFFKNNKKMRWLLQAVALLLVILYHFYLSYSHVTIDGSWNIYSIPGIRSMIIFFISTILFLWLPTIKSKIKFSDTFLVAFKAYFSTLFFSIVLYIGIFAIFVLFEFLFFSLMFNWGLHTSTLIFSFFAPIFFLTNIPNYHLEENQTKEAIAIPKFLHHLISYVFVPIMIVLTGIIVLYIVTNITNDFFSDNILEGLLLSYTISGWILLILANSIDNKLVNWFKLIFPYALIFVIVLQMISTFFQIQNVGVTHGRYFILLFGVGSVISGLWYIIKKRDLKLLPVVALIAGIIALIPPIDAITVSVNQQRNRINSVLNEYNMLDANGEVTPNPDVPDEDQETVLESLDYLFEISALNQVEWLPEEQYYQRGTYLEFDAQIEDGYFPGDITYTDVYMDNQNINIPIAGFDQMLELSLNNDMTPFTETVEMNEQTVEVAVHLEDEIVIELTPADGEATQTFDFSDVLEEFEDERGASLPIDELTFTEESNGQEVQIVIQGLYVSDDTLQLDFYLMF